MVDWVALGDRAIRFARPPVPPRAIVRAIRGWPHVIDVVVARDDIAVYFDRDPVVDPDRFRALATAADDPTPVHEFELAAHYDGADLEAVARAIDATADEVCRLHASATYAVETMGFSPGFAYMIGLDPRLVLPRRASPRPRVPAGSIAIAGPYTAVYPFDSPGGWHLIGRVATARMFGPQGPLLHLGDRVRFVP